MRSASFSKELCENIHAEKRDWAYDMIDSARIVSDWVWPGLGKFWASWHCSWSLLGLYFVYSLSVQEVEHVLLLTIDSRQSNTFSIRG